MPAVCRLGRSLASCCPAASSPPSRSTAAAAPTSASSVLLRGASPCSTSSSVLPTAARTLTLAMADATDKSGNTQICGWVHLRKYLLIFPMSDG